MTHSINLDWTKLLAFDQAPASQDVADRASITDPRAARLGTKLGGKVGDKQGGGAIRPNAKA